MTREVYKFLMAMSLKIHGYPYYLRLQCQSKARIMLCIFSDHNPSWFSIVQIYFWCNPRRVRHPTCLPFDSKTLATAKRHLYSAAALESIVVVSDLMVLVSTTAKIFIRQVSSFALLPALCHAVSLPSVSTLPKKNSSPVKGSQTGLACTSSILYHSAGNRWWTHILWLIAWLSAGRRESIMDHVIGNPGTTACINVAKEPNMGSNSEIQEDGQPM